LVAEALSYIEHATLTKRRPFFLLYAMDMVHTPLTASSTFKGRSAHGLYGDVVEEMDSYVGQIMKKLEELNIADNTFVVFTSDNGPHRLVLMMFFFPPLFLTLFFCKGKNCKKGDQLVFLVVEKVRYGRVAFAFQQ